MVGFESAVWAGVGGPGGSFFGIDVFLVAFSVCSWVAGLGGDSAGCWPGRGLRVFLWASACGAVRRVSKSEYRVLITFETYSGNIGRHNRLHWCRSVSLVGIVEYSSNITKRKYCSINLRVR